MKNKKEKTNFQTGAFPEVDGRANQRCISLEPFCLWDGQNFVHVTIYPAHDLIFA